MINNTNMDVPNEGSDQNKILSSGDSQFPGFQNWLKEQRRKRYEEKGKYPNEGVPDAMRSLYNETLVDIDNGKGCKKAMILTLEYEAQRQDNKEYSRDQIRRIFMQIGASEFPGIHRKKNILPLLLDINKFGRKIMRINKPIWLSEYIKIEEVRSDDIDNSLDMLVRNVSALIGSLESNMLHQIEFGNRFLSSQDDIKLLYALRHLLEIATKKKEQVDSKDEAGKLTDQLKD